MDNRIDILTLEDLRDAVRQDANDRPVKELAKLFITAMNDWPGEQLKHIEVFVRELKAYYGEPLTVPLILSKKHEFGRNLNSWRAEAGASIREMIALSAQYDNESDFDEILKKITSYYAV